MESAFKELEVITHYDFLSNVSNIFRSKGLLTGNLEALIFNNKTIFKNLNGKKMMNDDVLKVITTLSMQVEPIIKADFTHPTEEFKISNGKCKCPLYLTEFSKTINDDFANKFGYHFWNSDNFEIGFKSAMFNTERLTGVKLISINNETPKFEFTLFSQIKQPANFFILNDQYIGSWTKDTFERNIIPLIKNLTNMIDSDSISNLILSTKIKKDFKIGRNSIFNMEESINNIKILNNYIKDHLPKNIKYRLITYNEALLDKDRSTENNSLKKELNSIKNSLKELHDRFFESNYIIGSSTNSFSYINDFGSVNPCNLELFSTIDRDHVIAFNKKLNALDSLKKYISKDFKHNKYFITFERGSF